MIILTIRTDKPEAEIGLFNDAKQLVYETWHAHRELAETIHHQMANILQVVGKDWDDIEGIIVYKGPGSFTGLRIGLSVANTLAYSLATPMVGTTSDDWRQKGIKQLLGGKNQQMVVPEYGAPVHVTKPRK